MQETFYRYTERTHIFQIEMIGLSTCNVTIDNIAWLRISKGKEGGQRKKGGTAGLAAQVRLKFKCGLKW